MAEWIKLGKTEEGTEVWQQVPTKEDLQKARDEARVVSLCFGFAALGIVLTTGVVAWLG